MGKREVPIALKQLLKLDITITNAFCSVMDKIVPLPKYRSHFKGIELTCHGIPWIAIWLIYIWAVWSPPLFEMQVNFFVGLILDILVVAVVKAVTRRRRPVGNQPDMLMAVGPDKFAFPSGHVSRSFYVSGFFTWLHPLGFLFRATLWAWAAAVTVTRVLLRRHHLLDVVCGALLGLAEIVALSVIWIGPSAASWLVLWLSEEPGVEDY